MLIISGSCTLTCLMNSVDTENLSVFPNPNNGNFTISQSSEGTFILINNRRQTVQIVLLNPINNNSAKISDIANGIYILIGLSDPRIKNKIVIRK